MVQISVNPPDVLLYAVPVTVCRYTWRRGSVPLWWSVTIRNGGMGEAEIKIHTTNTFRGSRRYGRHPAQQQYCFANAVRPA